jgi:cysteinyl-tRNA synthetase
LEDDFNTPEALQILWKLIRDENAEGKVKTIRKMDEVLGLDLLKEEKLKIPSEIKKFFEEREKSRREKNWKLSDELRNKIREKGFEVSDSAEGQRIEKIK